MNSQQQQLNELMSRPDINQVIASYKEMQQKIAQQLTDQLGLGNWQDKHDGEQSGCANEFPNVERYDVVRQYLNSLSTDKSISTEQWSRATSIASQVASGYGFTRSGPSVDKPPHHNITLLDQYGAELFVGTEQRTVISVTTGCHLTPDAKTRGTATTSTSGQ